MNKLCKKIKLPRKELSDIIDECSNGYGQDGEAQLSGEHSAAASSQGEFKTAIPDVYEKTCGVHNAKEKSQKKEKEDYSGKRTKKFEISGCVTIEESQCGGIIETTNNCKKSNGSHDAEQVRLVKDADAEVDQTCSCSGEPTCDCDCCCSPPVCKKE